MLGAEPCPTHRAPGTDKSLGADPEKRESGRQSHPCDPGEAGQTECIHRDDCQQPQATLEIRWTSGETAGGVGRKKVEERASVEELERRPHRPREPGDAYGDHQPAHRTIRTAGPGCDPTAEECPSHGKIASHDSLVDA